MEESCRVVELCSVTGSHAGLFLCDASPGPSRLRNLAPRPRLTRPPLSLTTAKVAMPTLHLDSTESRPSPAPDNTPIPSAPTVYSIHRITSPTGRVNYVLVFEDGTTKSDVTHETILDYVDMPTLQKYEHESFKKDTNMETRYVPKESQGGWVGGTNVKTAQRQIERSRKEALQKLRRAGEGGSESGNADMMDIDTAEETKDDNEPPSLSSMSLTGSRRRLRGDDTDRPTPPVRSSKRRKLVDMVADETDMSATGGDAPMDTEEESITIGASRTWQVESAEESDEIRLATIPARPTLPVNSRTSRKETTTPAPSSLISPSRKSTVKRSGQTQQSSILQFYGKQTPATIKKPSSVRTNSPSKQLINEHSASTRKSAPNPPSSSHKPPPLVTTEVDSEEEDELTLSPRRISSISKPRPRTKSGLFFDPSAASSTSTSPPPSRSPSKKAPVAAAAKTPKPVKAKTPELTPKPPKSAVKKEKPKSAKKPAKRARVAPTDEEEAMYEVEKILKHRDTSGVREFYIKWLGYDKEEDNTWEPEENLTGSIDLVQEYVDKLNE